ncbi:sterol homeostasis protein ARV1 Ecym_4168 [Eremothecium cymbalariae DBVPG|uniref:Protein ARV n=1 Tax=Eremothecium cymbalariae (strain CBS 270.75 / DBVPG 7215 / KCTC 17166 / NRRL Y-17582) TaxID=931890 RepID=G8JT92_ERECY|nr:hypothetical protein Ecym_4168 [Eremothecium cymbalariae DBVPG\
MICINCGCHVKSLYVKYSKNHIRLTDCPNCQQVVDKYVEFDMVLLFINLLLLKPGAYRHLVFNSLEMNLRDYPDHFDNYNIYDFRVFIKDWALWFKKYNRMNRIWLLLITFEVYLTWVTEESKYNNYYKDYKFNSRYKIVVWDILQISSPLHQYIYFAFYVIGDLTLLNKLTQQYLLKWAKWGTEYKYSNDIISYTMLLSHGAKIFPILMLIWPYDSLISTSIIKWIANFYLIESLKIVTNKPYSQIILLFTCVFLIRCVVVKSVLTLILSKGNIIEIQSYIRGEFELLRYRYLSKRDIFL